MKDRGLGCASEGGGREAVVGMMGGAGDDDGEACRVTQMQMQRGWE